MQRVLKISKYRNIGLDKPEKLVINNSIKKGEAGNLVILIGANNSGKSNVLDALKAIKDGKLQSRDVTTLSFEEKDRVPKVSFEVEDKHNLISYDLTYGAKQSFQINVEDEEIPLPSKEALKADVNAAVEICKNYGRSIDLSSTIAKIDAFEGQMTKEFADEIRNTITGSFRQPYGYSLNDFARYMPSNGYWASSYRQSLPNSIEKANSYCLSKYGIKFLPNIVFYKEQFLSKNDLQTAPGQIRNSLFFISLFKAIGIPLSEIENTYKQYDEFSNPAILRKLKKKIDSSISILTNQFNKLYFAESDEYKFMLSLDDSLISFGMARGKDEDPIMLEYQSTGFRWFFNLFFNFLGSNDLHPGDIIVMDEPATNLHPKGQQELRSFMKDFAKKNDLTFIIATHSPFLIDVDNFDELRVISMENNRSKIDNNFFAVNNGDPDSLLPIKESLTIEQNVLYNLNTEVVWVEGITDYNYLTMFKALLGEKNLAFLPCNGIGNNDELQTGILKRLQSIQFHKRNLLVDGDNAGKKMKESCKGTSFEDVVCVSDLNEEGKTFVEIEDLFSKSDREKFGLPDKTAISSSLMKANCTLDSFSEETIANFRKLFELLKD